MNCSYSVRVTHVTKWLWLSVLHTSMCVPHTRLIVLQQTHLYATTLTPRSAAAASMPFVSGARSSMLCHVAHSARQIHGHTHRMSKQSDWSVRVTRVTNVCLVSQMDG